MGAPDPELARQARELAAEFQGRWKITLPFGGLFFRADYQDPPAGVTAQPVEDDTADGLRRKLARITARGAGVGKPGARQ